jgi:hypothetical protein
VLHQAGTSPALPADPFAQGQATAVPQLCVCVLVACMFFLPNHVHM